MPRLWGAIDVLWVGCILVVTLYSAHAQNTKNLTYVDVLRQLTDLDRLAHLQAGSTAGLFSSWDRNSKTVWGANGDAGQYLRVESNGEAVMMDVDGPGVIYRTWSANPMGKLRVYLDHSPTPTYEWNFPDLFDGQLYPFIKPLVYRRDSPQSASDCYIPIPFSKHIKITADQAHGEYYHFNYVLLAKSSNVASFRLPLSADEQTALETAAKLWADPGRDPKLQLPQQQKISKTVTLAPGQSVSLCDIPQQGMIRAVRARVQSDQRYAWRKLVLRGRWDGAEWPQILTPLGPFFGFDWDTAEYGSVVAGCKGGQAYQYFPMPFRKSASLMLENFLEAPATVEYEIEWAPLVRLSDDTLYFYARWRHEPGSTTFDYPFLETAGHGHFVGVSMPIDHPLDGWWGEGDEKVWVDNDDFPPYIGTGSEDYFGDAWGIRYLSGPSFGASSFKGHRTCNYRWHFMDFIPFTKRMRMTIENYGPNGQGPMGQYDYSSTAFWYQAELVPPFAQLRGVAYTGGESAAAKPGKMEYNPDTFRDLKAGDLQTYGLGVTFAQQAEDSLKDLSGSGRAKIVTDALRPYEFDRERAVDFGEVSAGQKLAVLELNENATGVFQPRLYTAAEGGLSTLTLESEGRTLPLLGKTQAGVMQLGNLILEKGKHQVTLIAVDAGHAILDSIQLLPVPRVPEAIEAEEMTIVRATGNGRAPKASDPMDSVSAGRILEFDADQAGQGFVLSLGKRPKLPYVLGVRPVMGPEAGVIQAFCGGNPLGPQFDLYAPRRVPGPSILPLGEVPTNETEIEIRMVGQNAQSNGRRVELDYFRWEPSIMGPGTAQGVWAQVSAVHDCEYRAQDLGGNYSGGHQLWVQPCNLKAWIDLAIEIPRAGPYEIRIKYTKSWDYATVQAHLDGALLGPESDTYAPSVIPGETLNLGQRGLKAGRHILRLEAVGHNAASKGYLIGIDHIIVKAL